MSISLFIYIYFWLCWVFVSVRGLSLVAASGGHSSSRCAGLSLSRPLLLRSTSSRRAGSVVVAHGPSCSTACGILPDQGSNPFPLHWQADSQPLRHQGSLKYMHFWSYLKSQSLLTIFKNRNRKFPYWAWPGTNLTLDIVIKNGLKEGIIFIPAISHYSLRESGVRESEVKSVRDIPKSRICHFLLISPGTSYLMWA